MVELAANRKGRGMEEGKDGEEMAMGRERERLRERGRQKGWKGTRSL